MPACPVEGNDAFFYATSAPAPVPSGLVGTAAGRGGRGCPAESRSRFRRRGVEQSAQPAKGGQRRRGGEPPGGAPESARGGGAAGEGARFSAGGRRGPAVLSPASRRPARGEGAKDR